MTYFSFTNSQVPVNSHLSFTNFDSAAMLLPSLEIDNWKLQIEATGGRA